MNVSRQNLAKISAVYAGLMFGIFWIPLRALESAGYHGPWAPVMFMVISLIVVSPLLVLRWRAVFAMNIRLQFTGLVIGMAFALYATAFIYTDVIRTALLFYLTSIWGFLLARYVLGDLITPIRWLSIGFGIAGMLIIFGADLGDFLPSNSGDWMALIAGIAWAFGSILMLTDENSNPINYGLMFFFWADAHHCVGRIGRNLSGLGRLPRFIDSCRCAVLDDTRMYPGYRAVRICNRIQPHRT